MQNNGRTTKITQRFEVNSLGQLGLRLENRITKSSLSIAVQNNFE